MTKTFENQNALPRLPIPTLEETAERYLKSVRPFLSPRELNAYTTIVRDFVNGQGQELQKRLKAYDLTQPNSWLENWWLALAYLSWRESVLVNSNWYIIVQKHPAHGQPNHQIKRAAGFISNFLNFKESLDEETLAPETTKAGPLCMYQYSRLFGITRVPKPGCDVLVGSHPCKAKHIIVLVQDQIYAVDVFDAKTGARIPILAIEQQLQKVLDLVQQDASKEAPIGILTGTHRDTWANLHAHLEKLDPVNRKSFEIIETALFAVALDSNVYPDVDSLAKNTFHSYNGHNRWFDKALSVIVTKDGMLGLNGEHSPCDALVPAILVDYAVQNEPAQESSRALANPTVRPPTKLLWKTDAVIQKGLLDAQVFIDRLIADSDLGVLHYGDYGGNFIKKMGKVSPDAYVQICLQLTYYRIHRKLAPTYETASTRKYAHARTETCRSLSLEMADFVKLFDTPEISAAEKLAAFRKAANAHVEYLAAASNGKGVDRHLLGLRLVMKEGEKKHDIFTHPIFAHSGNWVLSTSALFSGERVLGTGFGAVEPTGYGMNYLISGDMIKVGIESKKSCAETKTCKFRATLRGSLNDVRSMIESASNGTSKL